jgi:hypothetical protein
MRRGFFHLVLVRRRRLALWVFGGSGFVAWTGVNFLVRESWQGGLVGVLVLVSVAFGFVAAWNMAVDPTIRERDRYRLAWLSARRRAVLNQMGYMGNNHKSPN